MRRLALLLTLVVCGCSEATPKPTDTSVPTSTPEPTATATSTPEPAPTQEPTEQPAKVPTELAPIPERSFVLEVQKYNTLGYTFVKAESEGGPSVAIDISKDLSVEVGFFIWGDPVEQFTISRTLDMPELPQLDLMGEFLRNIGVSDECILEMGEELLAKPLTVMPESWDCEQYEYILYLSLSDETIELVVFPPE